MPKTPDHHEASATPEPCMPERRNPARGQVSGALRACALVLLILAAGCASVQDGPRSVTGPLAVDPALLGLSGDGGQKP